ncbi:MAG: serine hydrolase [Acidobacteriota bacterium]
MKTSALTFVIASLVALFVPNSGHSRHPDTSAPGKSTFSLPAPDPQLQEALRRIVTRRPLHELAASGRLSVALVDLCRADSLRYAAVNGDAMLYAASLPKIAVLLAAFERIRNGEIPYSPGFKDELTRMIRFSNNAAASRVIQRVGFAFIARTLRDSKYGLYDPARNGGLWVGKGYGGFQDRWKRDPLHHLSHGATARQVARFFVMLDRGLLVDDWCSRQMKEILSRPGVCHKFVKGLLQRPGSVLYRKSGTWRNWHSDAALVERGPVKYVAVALTNSPLGGRILPQLILRLDDAVSDAGSQVDSQQEKLPAS